MSIWNYQFLDLVHGLLIDCIGGLFYGRQMLQLLVLFYGLLIDCNHPAQHPLSALMRCYKKAHDLDTELSQGRQNGLNCTHVQAGASIPEAPGIPGPSKVDGDLFLLGPTVT